MKITKERIIIGILLVLLLWFGATIVRLENYHYAVQVGFCQDSDPLKKDQCLNEKETRTSWVWHLLYGLRIF